MTKASNVILVHGAWADGSSWSKVIPLLLNGGLRVTAVQLPLISLRDDVATVKRAIALEDGPIILARLRLRPTRRVEYRYHSGGLGSLIDAF